MNIPTSGRSPSPSGNAAAQGYAHLKTQPSSQSVPQDQLPLQDPTMSFDPTQFSTDSFSSGFGTDNLNYDQNNQYLSLDPFMNGIGANNSFTSQDINTSNPDDLAFAEFAGTAARSNSSLGAHSPHNLNGQTDAFSGYNNDQSLAPSVLYSGNQSPVQPSTLNPHNLSLDPMATMQDHSPTPPHLLSAETAASSHSPSPRHSPSPQSHQPMRPRNTSESLDPSSAAFPQGYPMGGDWGTGAAFRSHRRKTSDTLSEMSSHSNQASPYMGHLDSFDQNAGVSPMLNAQNDAPLFGDSLGFNQFSLNDNNAFGSHDHISPVHSIQNSPRLPLEQQPLPAFTAQDGFGLNQDLQFQTAEQLGFSSYQNMNAYDQNAFPSFDETSNIQLEGQPGAMSPPEINIDFAPPSRQPSFGPRQRASSGDALIPPENMRRKRAKSDPYSGSRPSSPGIPARGRSPSLQPGSANAQSLSPARIQLPPSRSPSPATSRNRSSSTASDSRQYLLDLADPERPSATQNDTKRQKHPATFQCHLCPKRFTRAYNLRSHLRTHTDERPFVCTVCGKAFARQHDRKRHEGLHSGEKKFVCKGLLKTGKPWGCDRRFARADALGRHFRSEAGRECIKPLLEEEAEERRRTWMEEQRQQQLQSQQGFVAPVPLTEQPQLALQFPAALLQMYPDLAGFDFSGTTNTIPEGMDNMDDELDYTGRSSFDASSGGEFDLSDNDMEVYSQMQMDQQQQQQQQQPQFESARQTWQ